MSRSVPGHGLSARAHAAVAVQRVAASASRALRQGDGQVIGGRLAQRVHPAVLAELAARQPIAVVSGTNGKTTTTRLLAAAVEAAVGPVLSNRTGANLTSGLVSALAGNRRALPAVLEVDELALAASGDMLQPEVAVLLNLSRDQLDRSNETRRISTRWRDLGARLSQTCCVANADDPLVVHAAMAFPRQVWVDAGAVWTEDAHVCPRCAHLIVHREGDWECTRCDLRRPRPDVRLDGDLLVTDAGQWPVRLQLPGRVNLRNAAMAAAAAHEAFGADYGRALAGMADVREVAGRYGTHTIAGREARLLLAKNPAGWTEMLALLGAEPARPVLVHIHARGADGVDPSWLWDVPMADLAGREVLVSGERAADIALRLTYAGVPHEVFRSPQEALAAVPAGQPVDVLATYTAFQELYGGAA